MKELLSPQGKLIAFLVLTAALVRLIPHEPNFTPIGAIALFGGTYILNKRLAFAVPLAAMLLSDLALQLVYGNGFHSSMIFIYAAFALVAGIGLILRKRIRRQTIMVASLVGSLVFFFVTNFGAWLSAHSTYPMTVAGLIESYVAGIPFFRGTVMGDLFYNLVMFGGFALAKRFIPRLAAEPLPGPSNR